MRNISSASFANPASAGAYQAGDAIANSTTASAVVPLVFDLPYPVGYITGARCVVTPASGNLIIAAFAFDLLLFKSEKDIPFAAGSFAADNAALTLTTAAQRNLIARIPFSAASWASGLGSVVTGAASGRQEAGIVSRMAAPFHASGAPPRLIGLLQAQAAWTPTAVINQFDFVIDLMR
jgi:hypothetical protein